MNLPRKILVSESAGTAFVGSAKPGTNDATTRHINLFRLLGFGLGYGVRNMEGRHYLMLLAVFALGYVVARMWPGPGQAVGLP